MTDNRALRRALQIERKTRKLYARRLRGLMTPNVYEEFVRVCRAEAFTGCEVQSLAKESAAVGDG